jgi:heme/copper-type cytochrome/quinol oxidase subunit 3
MRTEAPLDVSHLPAYGFGLNSPIYLGQIGMMLIEGTLLATLLVVYAYVRSAAAVWPPPGVATPELLIPTVALAVLLLSAIPMKFAGDAVMEGDWSKTLVWTVVNIGMAIAFLILRTIELNRLDYKWSSHIYGSIAWVAYGLHTMHAMADTLESIVLALVIFVGWRGPKQRLAVKADGLYWYFVIAVWIPFYLVLDIYPRLIRS